MSSGTITLTYSQFQSLEAAARLWAYPKGEYFGGIPLENVQRNLKKLHADLEPMFDDPEVDTIELMPMEMELQF